jgi:hypothetical protein
MTMSGCGEQLAERTWSGLLTALQCTPAAVTVAFADELTSRLPEEAGRDAVAGACRHLADAYRRRATDINPHAVEALRSTRQAVQDGRIPASLAAATRSIIIGDLGRASCRLAEVIGDKPVIELLAAHCQKGRFAAEVAVRSVLIGG